MTVRIDKKLKAKMRRARHVNWPEVIRNAIAQRIELEETRAGRRINMSRLRKAIADQDRLRGKTRGTWSGAEEIRKWRELRCSKPSNPSA